MDWQQKGREIADKHVLGYVDEMIERYFEDRIEEQLETFPDQDYDSALYSDIDSSDVGELLAFMEAESLLDMAELPEFVKGIPFDPENMEVGDVLYIVDEYDMESGLQKMTVESVNREDQEVEFDGSGILDFNRIAVFASDPQPSFDTDKAYQRIKENGAQEKACEALGIEPSTREFYHYVSVSNWLAHKLEEQGEIVADVADLKVWGRTTSGQDLIIDGCMQNIAEQELEKDREQQLYQAEKGQSSAIYGVVDGVYEDRFDLKVGKITMPIPYDGKQELVEMDKVKVEINGSYIDITKLEPKLAVER